MSRTALAFMSYVNEDDRHDNGWMTQFRERLSGEVRMHTGEPFDIFQDRKDIAWGQQWQERINQSLDAVTFLIPILTPAFFKSAACRDELERFLKREETLGCGDLILPVYYVNCPVLQDEAKREHDNLAKVVAKRQYEDWRDLRFEDFTSPQLRKALAKVAQQIMTALEHSRKKAARAAAQSANAAKETPPPPQATKKGSSVASGTITVVAKHKPTAKTKQLTLVVDPWHRGDYTTITDALKGIKAGTRILVRPGLYREDILLLNSVEIIGDGERNDIVIQGQSRSAVSFLSDNGRLANLTLRHVNNDDCCCVDIVRGRLELEDCDISSQGIACVAIHIDAIPRLRRCRIHHGKSGVLIYENSQGTLEDNEIFANEILGILIMTGGSPTLRRNRIYQNGCKGIFVDKGGGGIFEDNDLRGNTKGAWEIDPDCEANVQRSGNKE